MIDVKNLSDLLSNNTHPQLYPKIFVMSPTGSLIAYSTPADMLEVRDQAALISMVWREQEEQGYSMNGSRSTLADLQSNSDAITALTVEFESCNIIARMVQPNLVLVLVGGVFPDRQGTFKLITEREGDPTYPSGGLDLDGDIDHVSSLQLQRKKADKLVAFIEAEAKTLTVPNEIHFGKPLA